jgi:microcystin-dependent protein
MSEPFVGEIRQFPYSFAPHNFAYCAGQLMPIQQNTALFSLLGVNYGGNGTSNFGLPNLQGRAMMHQGNGPGLTPRTVGEAGGVTAVTLLQMEIPSHNHLMTVKMSGGGNVIADGAGAYLSISEQADGSSVQRAYSNLTNQLVPLAPTTLSITGGGQAHENRQPYIVIPFCIALFGMFPSRN